LLFRQERIHGFSELMLRFFQPHLQDIFGTFAKDTFGSIGFQQP
jgi:hypothetical protein